MEREWQIRWSLNLLHHPVTPASRILWLTPISLLHPLHQNNKTWTTLISLPQNLKNHQDSHNNWVKMMFWAGLNRIRVTYSSLKWVRWQDSACKNSVHLCQLRLSLIPKATSSTVIYCSKELTSDKVTLTIYKKCMIHRLKTWKWCSHKIKTSRIVLQNLMNNIKTFNNKWTIRASN